MKENDHATRPDRLHPVTADIKAAEMPVGSIVANDHTAWIKTSKTDGDLGSWNGTGDEMSTYDWEPQEALDNGAIVLREGAFVTAIDEPENGERVAVDVLDDIRLYRRDDAYAQAEDQPERNWRLVSRLGPDEDGSDCTWAELTGLGAIAYVGRFVDRTVDARHSVL